MEPKAIQIFTIIIKSLVVFVKSYKLSSKMCLSHHSKSVTKILTVPERSLNIVQAEIDSIQTLDFLRNALKYMFASMRQSVYNQRLQFIRCQRRETIQLDVESIVNMSNAQLTVDSKRTNIRVYLIVFLFSVFLTLDLNN